MRPHRFSLAAATALLLISCAGSQEGVPPPPAPEFDTPPGQATTPTTAQFRSYAPEAIGEQNRSLLFFAASWSSKSREYEDFLSGTYTTDQRYPVPTFKVDFDGAAAEKARYGITKQDIFVLVDSRGTALEILDNPSETELLDIIRTDSGDIVE